MRLVESQWNFKKKKNYFLRLFMIMIERKSREIWCWNSLQQISRESETQIECIHIVKLHEMTQKNKKYIKSNENALVLEIWNCVQPSILQFSFNLIWFPFHNICQMRIFVLVEFFFSQFAEKFLFKENIWII